MRNRPPASTGVDAPSSDDINDWFASLEAGRLQTGRTDELLVRSLVADLLPHLLPEVHDNLLGVDVCITPFKLYNATPVRRVDGQIVLVLHDGLLDTITASLELSHAISGFPVDLDTIAPRHDCPDISARAWAATLLAELLRRSCQHDTARPNLWPLVPGHRAHDVRTGLACAVLWTLLHELGHVRLDHLDMRAIGRLRVPQTEDFLVPEKMTPMHQAELDADHEAYLSLSPAGRPLCFAWMRIALAPQMMFDSLLAQRSGAHPLSVNRLRRILDLVSGTEQACIVDGTEGGMQDHADTFKVLEDQYLTKSSANSAAGLSQLDHASLSVLIKGLSLTLENTGVILSRVLGPPEHGWRDYARTTRAG